MLAALQIADEFGFQVRAFHHALEAYKIRDVLAKKRVGASPGTTGGASRWRPTTGSRRTSRWSRRREARAIVHSDSAIAARCSTNRPRKALAAGRAAGVKLDEDDALKWLTANPAWALGIDAQVGTLEPGKRADVVVWSGIRSAPTRGQSSCTSTGSSSSIARTWELRGATSRWGYAQCRRVETSP